MKQQLGDRMKINYEQAFTHYLPWRMPVIVRLDGKAFHNFTHKMKRPFDEEFISRMQELTKFLCSNIPTSVFAYSQSDEISLLLHSYRKLDSEPWFRNEIQKIASISAGLASSCFSRLYDRFAIFDARCFILPEDEVVNYFIWRQQDATRNSINMVAQSKFSHKELLGKDTKEVQEMMFQKDKTNWNDFPTYQKRGFVCYKKEVVPEKKVLFQGKQISKIGAVVNWYIDMDIPIFSQDRDFIHKWLRVEEE